MSQTPEMGNDVFYQGSSLYLMVKLGEIDISPNRATVFDMVLSCFSNVSPRSTANSTPSHGLFEKQQLSVWGWSNFSAAYPLRYFRSVFTVYVHTSGRSNFSWDVIGLISGDSGDASSDCRPIKGRSVFCGGQFTDMMHNMQNNMFFLHECKEHVATSSLSCRLPHFSGWSGLKVAPLCSHWPSWFANTPNWQGEPQRAV